MEQSRPGSAVARGAEGAPPGAAFGPPAAEVGGAGGAGSEDRPPPGPAHSSHCDRRLSRAARDIVRRDVAPVVRHYAERLGPGGTGGTASPGGGYWGKSGGGRAGGGVGSDPSDLLVAALDSLGAASHGAGGCPLDPRLDLYRHHELRSSVTGNANVPIAVSKRGRKRRQALHRCGMCGRAFFTRYYLDRHMDERHSRDLGDAAGSVGPVLGGRGARDWVCPASDLCPSLGGLYECERVALELEPYYDRGSGGVGPDRSDVRRKLQSRLDAMEPCDESEMAERRRLCSELFQGCFGSDYRGGGQGPREVHRASQLLVKDLTSHVCERLTCSARLHSLAGHSFLHVHHWHDLWYEHHAHSLGVWGVLGLLIIGLFYLGLALGCCGLNASVLGNSQFLRRRNRFGELRGFSARNFKEKRS